MKWTKKAAGVRERVPFLLADVTVWRRWNGDAEAQAAFDMLDGVVGVVDVDGRAVVPMEYDGGELDAGVSADEVVVLQHYTDADDLEAARTAIAKRSRDEYAAGELAITEGLVIGDPWTSGSKLPAALPTKAGKLGKLGFFVPLPSGTYVVLEGRTDDVVWYRLRQGRAKDYPVRPAAAVERDPRAKEIAGILGRLKFGSDREQARALEDARKLVDLGRPDSALEICHQVSESRKKLAQWTSIFALAALGRDAVTPLRALAVEWLAPATSADSANQALTRENLLAAVDAVAAAGADVASLRAAVVAAPQPEIFMGGGGDDFF